MSQSFRHSPLAVRLRRLEPPPLYAIADGDVLGLERVPAAVETIAKAGIRWIQIRAKHAADGDLFGLTKDSLARLRGTDSSLWINDRPDLAALLPIAGVHLGQDDLPPAAARRVLVRSARRSGVDENCWIGRSTHDLKQAEAAEADPAVDVIAFGPIFDTTSKQQPDPVVGLNGLREVRRRVTKPLVAIGGIVAGNLATVLAAGADSVAILGAVCHGDIASNCGRLRSALQG